MFKLLQSYYEEYYKKTVRREKGAIFTMTAILLPVIIGFAGLAFDAGNLYFYKARLQDTADAAALAGGRAYVNSLGTGGSVTLTQEQLNAKKPIMIAAADEYIAKNNPLYKEKLDAGQGNTKKSYAIGKETKTDNSNKSTEYFRVTLTETAPVYLLPVLGLQNIADVSVYATVKMTDTELKPVKPEEPHADDGYDPLVIAGSNLNISDAGKPNSCTFDFKLYVTGKDQEISAIKENNKYYVSSSNGQLVEIDQTKQYNMDRFGEEMRKLFRQLRTQRDPDSSDEYYMTYHGPDSFNDKSLISNISKNPENYGLKKDEHSYLYLSYSKMAGYQEGGILPIQNFNIKELYTGTLPSGKTITEDTPYYILIDKDVKIQNFEIEATCKRPVIFCYMKEPESEGEYVKVELHNNKGPEIKSIIYSPHVKLWMQINSKNGFLGSFISDKVEFGTNKTTFEYDVKKIEKWMEGEDGLKFTPSIGFYQDPGSGSSPGSGGATETVNEISLPDRLRLVLAGNTTDESHYKDAAVKWSDL